MTKFRAIAASYVGVLVCAAFIFIGAGKLLFWPGLLYVIVALIGTTLSHALQPRESDLTVDRATRAAAGETWDKRILGALFLVSLVTFLIAGLDAGRFRWSGRVPMGVTVAGVVLMLLGQIGFAMAKRENRFFSSTVRLQTERGHLVCDTGLYRHVRHPGYLGMLASMAAFPLVLNSYLAFIPTVAGVALLLLRTVLEDRMLTAQLPGYREYASKTKWRLVPGVF